LCLPKLPLSRPGPVNQGKNPPKSQRFPCDNSGCPPTKGKKVKNKALRLVVGGWGVHGLGDSNTYKGAEAGAGPADCKISYVWTSFERETGYTKVRRAWPETSSMGFQKRGLWGRRKFSAQSWEPYRKCFWKETRVLHQFKTQTPP